MEHSSIAVESRTRPGRAKYFHPILGPLAPPLGDPLDKSSKYGSPVLLTSAMLVHESPWSRALYLHPSSTHDSLFAVRSSATVANTFLPTPIIVQAISRFRKMHSAPPARFVSLKRKHKQSLGAKPFSENLLHTDKGDTSAQRNTALSWVDIEIPRRAFSPALANSSAVRLGKYVE